MKTGYKVVHHTGRSMSMGHSYGAVIYHLNQTTTPLPDCGPLFVYTTHFAASCYCNGLRKGDYIIYECQYEPWDKPLPEISGHKIIAWTDTMIYKISHSPELELAMSNMDLAKSVTPIRIVDRIYPQSNNETPLPPKQQPTTTP